MWVTVHAFSGLALGVFSPLGAGLTLPAALVLHAVLDLVPHWDYTRHPRRLLWAALDVGVAVVVFVVMALTLDVRPVAFAVGVVSALPDLDVFDAVMPARMRRRWFPSHWAGFPHGKTGSLMGIPVQLVVALGSLAAAIMASL